jgi:trimeric autotransporter adhesin
MLMLALMDPLGAQPFDTLRAVPSDVEGQQGPAALPCRVTGHVTSGGVPLPGVSITMRAAGAMRAATSTETNGTFSLPAAPGDYTLSAELTGFTSVERPIALTAGSTCGQTVDLTMTLAPRVPLSATSRAIPPGTNVPGAGRGAAPATTTSGRGARNGFETVQVQQADAAAAQTASTENEDSAAATRLLLPPGFSTDVPSDAIAINGTNASMDRGMLNDRFGAIGRGEFDPMTGEMNPAFGGGIPGAPGAQANGRGGRGGDFGGRGGPGAFGRGGPGGPGGGFFIGGRGGQQNRYNAMTNYTFGGSALDSAPYQLRPDATTTKKPYTKNGFGLTLGGPVKIRGLYDGTRRTNFVLSYNGNRGNNLFDQYATVPTEAMRTGDFSSLPVQLVDPLTGQPFTNNQIPSSRIDPASQSLLRFIPLPNLAGTTRNFHNSTTIGSARDSMSLRLTHNFTPNVAGGGRGGGRGGGFGGGRGAGRGGAVTGTAVNMTAQVQYTRNDANQANVLPSLGGHTSNTSFALPVTLNIRHKRSMHTVNVNFSETKATTTNHFAGTENVAGEAGIAGVSSDPFDYGVPALSFSTFSSVRDLTPTRRSDRRLSTAYSWTQPWKTHLFRAGGDVRLDRTASQTDQNAAGSFVFTGLYSAGAAGAVRTGGLDFADFLLGLPQQATVQYGPGNVQLHGKSMSLFVQDDWRKSAKLTLSLGVRYELLWPFTEANGHLVNLDVPSDFTAAVPVQANGSGPFNGQFPAGLIRTDTNNIAPRLGGAYRIKPGFVLRGGYGVSFNSGSYSTIARQLAAQPPFATSDTVIGSVSSPLLLVNPFAVQPAGVLNNYGIDPNYALGRVQTWNADLSKELTQAWIVSGGYTRTTGSSLDIVRAPNRNPSGGLRIDGVQPFLWQTSQGISVLNAGTFRLQRRMVKGIGGGITYTLAKSLDNASNYGGGGTVVAQNDQNLAAEYSLSSFDRRHQIASNVSFELPFGANKRWLHSGGRVAALFADWRGAVNFTWQTGTPLTPRVVNSTTDVSRGVSGTLRADYVGGPIQIAGPTIDQFFNTAAFRIPAPGTFGTAERNLIVGPPSRQLDAQFSRDVRTGRNHSFTIQASATNLLNLVNYAAVNTVVNSIGFGQVTSVRPMRSVQLSIRFRY